MVKRTQPNAQKALLETLRSDFVSRITRTTPGECFTRGVDLRTVNSAKRQVEVVATTEDPALVFDYSSYRVVLEVLLMSGAEYEAQTPLLRDHNQYLVTAICGSFTDVKTVQDRLEGLITVGKDLDDVVEGIWRRIEQGHLRRVSIGYDYTKADYVTIAAGETAIVDGRSFTAPKDRDLRVVKRWRLRELSLVVIPADARAQMKHQEQERRGTDGDQSQNSNADTFASSDDSTSVDSTRTSEVSMKKFLAFLHKHGMATHITDESQALAWARSGNLTAEQITELAALCKSDNVAFDPATAEAKRTTPTTTATRSGTAGQREGETESEPITRTASAETIDVTALTRQAAADALAGERQRITQIRQLGREHEIADNVIEISIDQGHSLDQAREAFLNAMRQSRTVGAPAIIVRQGMGGEQGVRVLQAALLLKEGINPDSPILSAQCANTLASRREMNIGWACHTGTQGERRNALESAFDQARQRGLHNASWMRLAQELVELETGQRAPYNQDELLQRAFATANFTSIFGAVVHLSMFAGYASTPATYERFCQVIDVPDFRDNSEAMMGEVGRLKKQPKSAPGVATPLNLTDPVLAKIAADRYAGMLKITEQNFINDGFGALGQTPFKLGQSVRALIADIVMSELMSTANLADGRTRFNTTDGNLVASGGTADVAGLTVMEKMLRAVAINGRRIQLGKTVIVTGLTLGPKFRVLSGTSRLVTADNPFAGTFETVEDTAVDIGVSDPRTDPETAISARPNSYFGLTADGNAMKVAFRSGTNRGPVTRSTVLQNGEWGMGWDVYVDMGAAFMRRTGAVEIRT